MQYTYRFSAYNGLSYTIVSPRYSQARKHFMRTFSGFMTVVYGGRYRGATVKNNTVISIK